MSAVVALLALLLLVDLFLPWVPVEIQGISLSDRDGFEFVPGLLVIALLLWELGIVLFEKRRPWDTPVALALAAATGIFGLVGFATARSNDFLDNPNGEVLYGAWLALPLSVLILIGAGFHLLESFAAINRAR